jgi:hypothetical protein
MLAPQAEHLGLEGTHAAVWRGMNTLNFLPRIAYSAALRVARSGTQMRVARPDVPAVLEQVAQSTQLVGPLDRAEMNAGSAPSRE